MSSEQFRLDTQESTMTHEEFVKVKPLLDQAEQAANRGEEISSETLLLLHKHIPGIKSEVSEHLAGNINSRTFLFQILSKLMDGVL